VSVEFWTAVAGQLVLIIAWALRLEQRITRLERRVTALRQHTGTDTETTSA